MTEREPARAPRITIVPGGPAMVRGDVELVGVDGEPIDRRRATIALCRCGRSRSQPHCDGSHAAGRAPIPGDRE